MSAFQDLMIDIIRNPGKKYLMRAFQLSLFLMVVICACLSEMFVIPIIVGSLLAVPVFFISFLGSALIMKAWKNSEKITERSLIKKCLTCIRAPKDEEALDVDAFFGPDFEKFISYGALPELNGRLPKNLKFYEGPTLLRALLSKSFVSEKKWYYINKLIGDNVETMNSLNITDCWLLSAMTMAYQGTNADILSIKEKCRVRNAYLIVSQELFSEHLRVLVQSNLVDLVEIFLSDVNHQQYIPTLKLMNDSSLFELNHLKLAIDNRNLDMARLLIRHGVTPSASDEGWENGRYKWALQELELELDLAKKLSRYTAQEENSVNMPVMQNQYKNMLVSFRAGTAVDAKTIVDFVDQHNGNVEQIKRDRE